ncbi:LPD1 domain-containing protein [Faecalibaculum rodentium]|uniref:LPD1 domain-containing protein n=6 Tax=Faecalibaculum rodentium TaxID=1702221 RepID=UPI002491133F|nr:LPD1 domain-containing protein [Faecalibaculum rodentium]
MARRKKKRLDDFGEKIGGARKDVYLNRGMTVEELAVLDPEILQRELNKKTLWPKPDYAQMVERGMDISLVYAIKRMRDIVPAQPFVSRDLNTDKDTGKLIRTMLYHDYMQYLNFMKEAAESITDKSQFREFLKQHREQYMTCVNEKTDEYVMRERYASFFRNGKTANLTKVLKQLDASGFEWGFRFHSVSDDERVMTDITQFQKEIIMKQFCFTEEMKAMTHCQVFCYDPVEDILPEVYWIDKGVMPNLFAITQEDFITKACWETGIGLYDIQEDTYILYDAREQKILGLNYRTPQQAVAERVMQYEEEKEKVQLSITRARNKESWVPPVISHPVRTGQDYRHGMDAKEKDFLSDLGMIAGEFGNALPQQERHFHLNRCYDSFQDLAHILNVDPRSMGLGDQLAIGFASRGVGGPGAGAAHYEPGFNVINLTRKHGPGCLAHEWAHALDNYIGRTLDLNTPGKVSSYASVNYQDPDCPKSIRDLMDFIEHSDYKKNSQIFNTLFYKSGTDYWHTENELFARAFDCYVKDRLSELGMTNDYLTYNADSFSVPYQKEENDIDILVAFPVGQEREQINLYFDTMVREISEKGILHEAEFETKSVEDKAEAVLPETQSWEPVEMTEDGERYYNEPLFDFEYEM